MKRADIKAGVIYAETAPYAKPSPVVFLEDQAATVWLEPHGYQRSGRPYMALGGSEKPHREQGWSGRSQGYAAVRGDAEALAGLDCAAELAAFTAGRTPSREGLRFTLVYSLARVSGLYAVAVAAHEENLADERAAREHADAEAQAHSRRLTAAIDGLARHGIRAGVATALRSREVIGLDVGEAERLLSLLGEAKGPAMADAYDPFPDLGLLLDASLRAGRDGTVHAERIADRIGLEAYDGPRAAEDALRGALGVPGPRTADNDQPLTCVCCWNSPASRLLVAHWREQTIRMLCGGCAERDAEEAPGLPGFRMVTVLTLGSLSPGYQVARTTGTENNDDADEARANIGATVAYRAAGQLAENGVVTGTGSVAVFVRYEGDRYAKATDPADLTLVAEDPGRLAIGADLDLLLDAARYVIGAKRPVGTTSVQRHIRVGFAKAGWLLMLLEQEGIVARSAKAWLWDCLVRPDGLDAALDRIREAATAAGEGNGNA